MIMFKTTHLDELSQKLFAALPQSIHTLESDLRGKFEEILKSAFMRLDLVTREEFDVQTRVLARTREKVETLEQEIRSLMENRQASE